MISPVPLLCLDIGNTTCRGGMWLEGKITDEKSISTKDFAQCASSWLGSWSLPNKVSYCSVVPEVEKTLLSLLSAQRNYEFFRLTAESQSQLPIQYPKPNEIGADRIANSYAVYKKFPLPAVVVDLGTATTFDVVTKSGGYLGGVIVPGPQGMLDYLGNRTALLPRIDLSEKTRAVKAIGRSTDLAILSGICHGYTPMLKGILNSIIEEIEKHGEIVQSILQTGGEARNFFINGATLDNSLTLEGLALACLDQISSHALK